MSQENNPHFPLELKMDALRQNLLADTPALPTILQDIRIYLSKHGEDAVLALSEEAIGQIVQASMQVSRTKLIESSIKSKSGKTKALKDIDLSDLM